MPDIGARQASDGPWRQEALASRRGEVIAKIKEEVVPNGLPGGLPFNVGLPELSQTWSLTSSFQLSDEEVEGSASEAEVDAGAEVFSGALDRAPLPDDSRVPPGASPSASPVGALPFDSSTSASRGPTSGI